MSAFSFTAPYVTDEQEKAEREALSPTEKAQLEGDLFGTAAEPTPPPDITVQHVQEALQNIDEKQEYLQACQQALPLVETESAAIMFLRCCRYDPVAAAQRLVDYWKVRVLVFGPERAFLPMTIAGAMAADQEALQKGLVQILPDDDEHGRPVLFWDRIRTIHPVIAREQVVRIHFYMLHVMAKQESYQKKGYVWTVFLKVSYDLYKHFDRILDKKLFKVLYSMPIVFRAIHTFTGSGQSVVGITMPVIKHIGGKYFRQRLLLHAGSDKEILERLDMYGVKGAHLGSYVGGRFTREMNGYLEWLENERRNEQEAAEQNAA